jgi:hypothetical protein
MAQLTVQTAFNPKMNGSDGRGVVQVVKGDTNVTIWGSLKTSDATSSTGWEVIETFSANDMKEIVLADAMCISGSSTDVTVSVGTSEAYISATR